MMLRTAREVHALYEAIKRASEICPLESPAWGYIREARMILDGYDPYTARREREMQGSQGVGPGVPCCGATFRADDHKTLVCDFPRNHAGPHAWDARFA